MALTTVKGSVLPSGETTAAGDLVFPSEVPTGMTYNTDNTVATIYTLSTYNGYIWTITMTTYTNGNITLMTADNGAGGNSWTKTLGYDSNGNITSDGGWV